jgi:hypothetical protein
MMAGEDDSTNLLHLLHGIAFVPRHSAAEGTVSSGGVGFGAFQT